MSIPVSQGSGRAIVIGAGTTGLVAAAAAARHFAQVVVLDRDALPGDPAWRKGVPQSRHIHLLLQGGQNAMTRYFPDLFERIADAGGRTVDMAGDMAWHYAGGWKARFQSGITMRCQSKGLLEFCVRQCLKDFANVEIRDRVEVTGFQSAGGAVTGVEIKDGAPLDADLVIDASGRHSKSPARLAAMGCGEVPVSEVPVDVGYATRLFRNIPFDKNRTGILINPKYPDTRIGVIMPIENGESIVTLVGWGGDHPQADDQAFLNFARSLAVPDLYDAIAHAEPAGPISLHRFPGNLRRHYERLETMPEGLVVIGDAASSFNPIYGQGMSHGAMAAVILDDCLAEHRRRNKAGDTRPFSRGFQQRCAGLENQCWFLSTTEEFRDPLVSDHPPVWAGAANWYLDQLQEVTWRDEYVAGRFLQVMHLLAPPSALFDPMVVMRVLAHATGLDRFQEKWNPVFRPKAV